MIVVFLMIREKLANCLFYVDSETKCSQNIAVCFAGDCSSSSDILGSVNIEIGVRMRKNGHRVRLSLKESIFTKMLRCVSEQHLLETLTSTSRRAAANFNSGTVSDLQQRHVPILPIPAF